jgi:integrase/recombinase XerC/integrase/recombinase XerD
VIERLLAHINPERARRIDIERYLLSIPANGLSLGNRHAHYRVIKTFFNWLELEHEIKSPVKNITAPKLPKMFLPSLTKEQVLLLLVNVNNSRDKAIISMLTESGLRISELASINRSDINWGSKIVRVLGKGKKEAYAPFGELTEKHLNDWLDVYTPDGNIWGLTKNSIQTMLQRLQEKTGLPCNPHTFRRTFACLLRKAGVDTMTIKDLGRWESLEMVQRYTRSVSFQDSLKFYKAPLG